MIKVVPMAKSLTRLVLICGLPASGKSTLARSLASSIPAIRLDKDGWATALGTDPWDDEFRVLLEQQLWLLSLDLLARGQSVILEWGHWARVERDEKRLAVRHWGVQVELHYLKAPLEELIERAAHRNASGEWTAVAHDAGSLRGNGRRCFNRPTSRRCRCSTGLFPKDDRRRTCLARCHKGPRRSELQRPLWRVEGHDMSVTRPPHRPKASSGEQGVLNAV